MSHHFTPQLPDDLTEPEKRLIEAAAKGEECILGDGNLPPQGTTPPERTIRAQVIRFLALGGDNDHPVDPRGVMLAGAVVPDQLNLQNATVPVLLGFFNCRFKEPPDFINAHCQAISFDGSHLPGLTADRLTASGSLFLNNGFTADGEVRLHSAQINGNLDCSNATFINNKKNALTCELAKVTGCVFLKDGFNANGEVRLHGAQIGDSLVCSDATFNNKRDNALTFERAKVTGSVFLDKGFTANGEVRLLDAQIGSNLECINATFNNAIICQSTVIKHTLFLRDTTTITGNLNLTDATIGLLCDERTAWPKDGNLILDGCVYDSIGGPSTPTDAKSRLKWLALQNEHDLLYDFCPQPYEQLAKVFRQMGHTADAREVGISKQRQLREAKKARYRVDNCERNLYRNPEMWLKQFSQTEDRDTIENIALKNAFENPTHPIHSFLSSNEEDNTRQNETEKTHSLGQRITAERARLVKTNLPLTSKDVPFQLTSRIWRRFKHHISQVWSHILERTIGFGFAPWRVIYSLAILLLVGTFIFGLANSGKIMVPADSRIYSSDEYKDNGKSPPVEYPTFQSLAYSFDTLIPLVDLHQERYWEPESKTWRGTFVRFYLWSHIIAGWFLASLGAAGITGIIKKD